MTIADSPSPHNGRGPYQAPASDSPAQPPPTQATPGWHDHEPGYVHSLRWTDATTQVEHMTVIRADELEELWQRVRLVSQLIRAARQRAEGPPAAAEASQASRVAEAPAPRSALEASCPDHGTSRLKPSKYGEGVFCAGKSPRGDGSYCAYSWKPQA